MTLEEAKNLKKGQKVYNKYFMKSNRTPDTWTVNSKPKIWKLFPKKVLINLKRGKSTYRQLTQDYLHHYCLTYDEAMEQYRKDGKLCED